MPPAWKDRKKFKKVVGAYSQMQEVDCFMPLDCDDSASQ